MYYDDLLFLLGEDAYIVIREKIEVELLLCDLYGLLRPR